LSSKMMLERLNAEVTAIKEALKSLAVRLDEIEQSFKQMPPDVKVQLSLDPKEIEALPWRQYQAGEKAGWIYADLEEAEELRKMLESVNHPVKIGNYSYRLSRGRTRK